MTEKELHKLKRVELLEILVDQGKEIERLSAELEQARKELEDRKIRIDKAGTIAEAAFQLNGVFEAAQAASVQYLENIKYLSGRQEAICADMEEETRRKCAQMEQETKEKCTKMLEEAERGAEQKWENISTKLQDFYDAHQGLREILALVGENQKNIL